MKIERSEEVSLTLTVELDESEYFEITKMYTSKRMRVKKVTMHVSAVDGKFNLKRDTTVRLHGKRITNRGETSLEIDRLSFWADVPHKVPKSILDPLMAATKEWAGAL